VVQPEHGAFPELLAATEGGRLVRPGDVGHLSEVLHELLSDRAGAQRLGRTGRQRVLERFGADAMADSMLEVYRRFL
jgi:glycosyltransferase involved in cell wall biosynthesis